MNSCHFINRVAAVPVRIMIVYMMQMDITVRLPNGIGEVHIEIWGYLNTILVIISPQVLIPP